MSTVYLIHFDKPIGNPNTPHGQAQHYLGYADDLDVRLARHASGNGARLMEVIAWQLARTWTGDRALERRLKQRKNGPRLCPICNPKEQPS